MELYCARHVLVQLVEGLRGNVVFARSPRCTHPVVDWEDKDPADEGDIL